MENQEKSHAKKANGEENVPEPLQPIVQEKEVDGKTERVSLKRDESPSSALSSLEAYLLLLDTEQEAEGLEESYKEKRFKENPFNFNEKGQSFHGDDFEDVDHGASLAKRITEDGFQLVLNLIMKNEAENLPRCMESAARVCTYFVILDTGSTDNSVELALELGRRFGMNGRVVRSMWKDDYGRAREESLREARQYVKIEMGEDLEKVFTCFIDPDEYFAAHEDPEDRLIQTEDAMKRLNPILKFADSIRTQYFTAQMINDRIGMVRLSQPHYWHGVRHEVTYCDIPVRHNVQKVIKMIPFGKGCHRRDGTNLGRDAQAFIKFMEKHGPDSRSLFYTAQSFGDSGMLLEAFEYYDRRFAWKFKGYDQERYISRLRMTRYLPQLMVPLGIPQTHLSSLQVFFLLETIQVDPKRPEAYAELLNVLRLLDLHHVATAFYYMARYWLPSDPQGLFISRIDNSKVQHEASISSWYSENRGVSAQLNERLCTEVSSPSAMDLQNRETLGRLATLAQDLVLGNGKKGILPFPAPSLDSDRKGPIMVVYDDFLTNFSQLEENAGRFLGATNPQTGKPVLYSDIWMDVFGRILGRRIIRLDMVPESGMVVSGLEGSLKRWGQHPQLTTPEVVCALIPLKKPTKHHHIRTASGDQLFPKQNRLVLISARELLYHQKNTTLLPTTLFFLFSHHVPLL